MSFRKTRQGSLKTPPECLPEFLDMRGFDKPALSGDVADRKNRTGTLHGFKRSKLISRRQL